MNRKYSSEMGERALRMLEEARPEHPSMMSALRHVAGLLGMSPERCGCGSDAARTTRA